ncbi:GNAT family N-acetyltransferase [Vreelandella zhanjiangensis]|uniref:GNAT family N-acetyltransferase n=1 Tax=Vreelandella zhanjiangensis TaxID=1121960 RepID=UPI000370B8DF|nr:GNAT family N-acetyltransferase [Halomonas zhanjiangensis]
MTERTINELQESGLAQLTALEAQAQSGARDAQLHEALTDATTCVFGCIQAGELVGYAIVARLPFDAELQAIGVLPEHRHLGVGGGLMNAVLQKAAEWQSERVLLEVRAGNVAAISLYKRWGFGVDGLRKGYYPAVQGTAGREDAVLLSRTLS